MWLWSEALSSQVQNFKILGREVRCFHIQRNRKRYAHIENRKFVHTFRYACQLTSKVLHMVGLLIEAMFHSHCQPAVLIRFLATSRTSCWHSLTVDMGIACSRMWTNKSWTNLLQIFHNGNCQVVHKTKIVPKWSMNYVMLVLGIFCCGSKCLSKAWAKWTTVKKYCEGKMKERPPLAALETRVISSFGTQPYLPGWAMLLQTANCKDLKCGCKL